MNRFKANGMKVAGMLAFVVILMASCAEVDVDLENNINLPSGGDNKEQQDISFYLFDTLFVTFLFLYVYF